MSRSETTKEVKYKDKGYREVEALSYSAIACYNKSAYDYYKRYICKEESEETDSLRLGQIVDVLATDPTRFDEYFIIASVATPSPQLVKFCKFLIKNDSIEDFEERLKKSYNDLLEENGGKLQKKFPAFVEFFYTEAKDFYAEMLACKTKTLITIEEATLGEAIFKKYQEAKQFHCLGCLVLTKVPMYFTMMETEWKAEVDRLIISKELKTIQIRDVKISSFVEDFYSQAFLKRSYYLQMAVYMYGVKSWMQQNGYADYKVDNFSFEVVDATNRLLPLLYVCPDNYELLAWEGFVYNNRTYKGLLQLIEELQQSKKLGMWNMSIRNHKNNGVVMMPTINND